MKRSYRNLFVLALTLSAVLSATPALAQTAGEDAAGAAVGIGMMCCWGLIGLIFLAGFVWWIICLIDVFKRQEWEFPGSTGSSKTLWMIVLLVGGLLFSAYLIVAAVYHFMIIKKGPRPGTMAGPGAGGGGYAPPPAPPAPPAPPMAPPPPPPPAAPL